jgi:hypothetical protein
MIDIDKFMGTVESEILVALRDVDLNKVYKLYTTYVSPSDMATSFQQCCLLKLIVEKLGGCRILDTGSGISTYFIRISLPNSSESTTIDDNPVWIEKIKQFLEVNSLSTDRLLLWNDVRGKNLGKFDFIYHDLGCIETRIESLDNIAQRVVDGGIIMLDDLHFTQLPSCDLNGFALEYFKSRGWSQVDIKQLSTDQFGRYASIFIKPKTPFIGTFLGQMKYGYFLNINSNEENTKFLESLKWEGAYVGPYDTDVCRGKGIFQYSFKSNTDVLKAFDHKKSNMGFVIHNLFISGKNSENILELIYEDRINKFYKEHKYLWTVKIITLSIPRSDIQDFETFEYNLNQWFDLIYYKDVDEISHFYHSTYYYLAL